MKNPLATLVPVDERNDGVYITVSRDKKDKIDVEKVVAVLDKAGVINYDRQLLKKAFERGRGAPEKIGPLFEYYPSRFDTYVTLKVYGGKAFISIHEQCEEDGISPTASILRYYLEHNNIVHGIDQAALEDIASKKKFGEQLVVAKDTPAEHGKDASVEVKIATQPDFRPKVKANGRVDFKEVSTYIEVAKDQELARKRPATKGTPGKKVTGEEIEPTPGKDVSFPQGKNTYVSEDGISMRAEKAGVLIEENGLLTVKESLVINNDVDFRVGNVKYSGGVLINANVSPGFSVEAEGNIEIKGNVESARIVSRNGTVTIHEGVLGKDDTTIYGKEGITIAFAQSSYFETEGDLILKKHIWHSSVRCNRFFATEHTGNVLGGKLVAYKGVEVYDVGNDKGVETRIQLVNKQREVYKEQLKKLTALREQLNEKIGPIKKELNSKAAIFKKAGDSVTARHKKELKKWIDAYNELSKKLNYVDEKIAQVKEKVQNPVDPEGYIKIINTAHAGTVLNIYGTEKKIGPHVTNKTYYPAGVNASKSQKKEGKNE